MSGTVLEHPLVRDYLRRLDAACAGLPAADVRELREQIAAHLVGAAARRRRRGGPGRTHPARLPGRARRQGRGPGPAPSRRPVAAPAGAVAIGAGPLTDIGGGWDDQTRWSQPGAIPPHSYRLIRVLWVSHECNDPGGFEGTDILGLRVRVGIVTRTEHIQLRESWIIVGTKTSDPAPYCPS